MKLRAIFTALTLAFFASPALAAPNPFYALYQGDIAVTDVQVTYAENILESHSDRAASNFVENSFSDELRAEFEAAAASRPLSDDSYAERLSEFLVARSLRAHTAELTGARQVRLEVTVDEARINGMLSGALFGGAAFPRLGGVVRILDAETGALLATATIRNAQSWDMHNQAAAQTHGFRYNFSGTDTNFRLLAGSTEAMSSVVLSVLRAPAFADRNERTVLSTYPRIAITPPLFDVRMATP